MSEQSVTIQAGMSQAVTETLDALQLRPEHAALAQLATELASLLDNAATNGRALEAYHKLSPRLAGVLRELGATPAARPVGGGDDDGDGDDPADRELDELGARRRTRADRASGVDPAST